MEPRISIVTLGVDHLDRAAAFYEAMGLARHDRFTDGVAFFQMGGLILALWPREDLARDIGLKPPQAETGGRIALAGGETQDVPFAMPTAALAYNTRAEGEVYEILEKAKAAGGRIVKPAARAFWGGVQGYFCDPEGNLWEVAHNPDFPIDAEGRISLP
jgi:uncharacterized protein